MQNCSVHTVSLDEQPGLWDSLHDTSADASIFSSTKWLTLMGRAFERPPLGFVLTCDGAPVAGIPLLLHRRGPLRVSSPLPITLYAGLLHGDSRIPSLEMLFDAVERKFNFIALSTVTRLEDALLMRSRGWQLRKQETIRISLLDMENVWNGYNQSLRRKLRRASEGGFLLDNDPPVSLVVRMFEQSYRRHGKLPPIPGATMGRWLSSLRQAGIAQCFAARLADGRYAAVRVVIRSRSVLYDWMAGADPSVSPSSSHWLVHALLQHYSESGCTLFDFMGANTPGVTDFKRSFGGDIFEYHEAEWYRPAFVRHLNAARIKRLRFKRGFR
ncbi:MAG: GNAT family N-acetyltransferase [Bacteroidetes bacterium]|nr:GNAT family N-acetyltransferase [Bacteroidota bacterium]